MGKATKDRVGVHGFSRVHIVNSDGSIAGDSGWKGPNQVTNLGFQNFLSALLGNTTGSVQVTHVALGTGTIVAAAGTNLDGEVSVRKAVTVTIDTSKTVRFTATFASGDNFVTATKNIANIGLFATSASNTGTIFAGNTYASSSCAVNQNVNVSYEIRFA